MSHTTKRMKVDAIMSAIISNVKHNIRTRVFDTESSHQAIMKPKKKIIVKPKKKIIVKPKKKIVAKTHPAHQKSKNRTTRREGSRRFMRC